MSAIGKPPAGLRGCGNELPDETWKPSTPASFISHLQTWIESTIVVPLPHQGNSASWWSTAVILNWTWKSSPTSRRIACMISIGSRARFSSEPPYSSSRSLIAGERNCVIR